MKKFKLKFYNHAIQVCANSNKRLYSIKKIFFLAKYVKIQFLKTFVLPVFNDCLSLSICYSQKAIQKLSICYYLCLYKILKIKAKLNDRLLSFQHRALTRLLFFSHKLINNA